MSKINLGLVQIKCLNCGYIYKEKFEPTTVYSTRICTNCKEKTMETIRIPGGLRNDTKNLF